MLPKRVFQIIFLRLNICITSERNLIKGIIKSAHLCQIQLTDITLFSDLKAVRTRAIKIPKVKNKAISVNS